MNLHYRASNNLDGYMLNTIKTYLILSGTWTFEESKRRVLRVLYLFYSICLGSMNTLFFILLFSQVVRHAIVRDSHQHLIESISYLIAFGKIFLVMLIFRKNKVFDLLQLMTAREAIILNVRDAAIKRLYFERVRLCRLCNRCLMLSTSIGTSILIAGNLMQYIDAIRNESEGSDNSFMILSWLPFDLKKYRSISYLMNILFSAGGTLLFTVANLIMVTLIVFSYAQLEILQIKLKRFDEFAAKERISYRKMIGELVFEHSFVIQFVEKMNDSVKYATLIQFSLSSMNIAAILFDLTKTQFLTETVFQTGFLAISVAHIFFLCCTADEIRIQSVAISDAIYESQWYTMDEEIINMLRFIIFRAQKPLYLTVGPFFQLTTETGVNVMKAAWSYAALISNFVETVE